MCVIMWANKERPTPSMIERAFNHNKDGGGVAWRTTNEQGEPVVAWKKGLKVEEMILLAAELPIPFIMHFRIASIGGIRPSLTHPFPIGKNASLALEGQTKGHVLFHNGHWKDWNEHCLRAAGARDADGKLIQIPMGRWSDTRAMAWLCSIYGPGFMEFMPEQKGIVFGPRDMQIFDGSGWFPINDVWCSNDYFNKGQTVSGERMVQQPGHSHSQSESNHKYSSTPGRGVGTDGRFCKYGTGKDACINQTLDDDGYCFAHPKGIPRMRLASRDPIISGMSGLEHPTTVMGPAKPTGGSVVPPSPFVQRLPLELPTGEVISIELATYLYKQRQLSHNKLKRIKALWEVATSPHTKASKRAQQALRQMTIKIVNTQ